MRRAVALIESDSPGGDRVVTVRGEIDVGNAPALRDWLARASWGAEDDARAALLSEWLQRYAAESA